MRETYPLIQAYLKEYKRQDLTLEEIENRPHYKKVWFWWLAMAHFNINNHYTTFELVPRGLDGMYVVTKQTSTSYSWVNGCYKKINVISYETCKAIYGS